VGVANEVAEQAMWRVGRTLCDKWRIDRLIGLGGMGAVYEAEHRNNMRVAVKVLHNRGTLSRADRARFKREGYVANRVGHPGVVRVYDDDADEYGHPFLVMELLEGETVAAKARSHGGRLDPAQVLEVTERLLDVLVAAHAKRIYHRDIKPDNIFITTDGVLKVLDFGIARAVDPELSWSSTRDGTILGTPAFTSPEQARGRVDEIDARSDLWSVGATMFFLLTGRFVHEAGTPIEQLGLAMTASAPPLGAHTSGLPPAMLGLVDRALQYDPARRWPSAPAMLEAVRWVRENWNELGPQTPLPFVLEQRDSLGAAPTHDSVPSSTRRHRALRYARLAAIAVLTTMFGVLGLSTRNPTSPSKTMKPSTATLSNFQPDSPNADLSVTDRNAPPRTTYHVPLDAGPTVNAPPEARVRRGARRLGTFGVRTPSRNLEDSNATASVPPVNDELLDRRQ
jgi:serine/threonine protein kinase